MAEGKGASAAAPVGIVLTGHGESASHLLAAARAILGQEALPDVEAVDAGEGQTEILRQTLCDAIGRVDQGRGVLLIVDLLGSSPCNCGIASGEGHELATLGGLNLAMLLKLATLERRTLKPHEVATAVADSARRSVTVQGGDGETDSR
jgi:PTS system mannose-specific IIA component